MSACERTLNLLLHHILGLVARLLLAGSATGKAGSVKQVSGVQSLNNLTNNANFFIRSVCPDPTEFCGISVSWHAFLHAEPELSLASWPRCLTASHTLKVSLQATLNDYRSTIRGFDNLVLTLTLTLILGLSRPL